MAEPTGDVILRAMTEANRVISDLHARLAEAEAELDEHRSERHRLMKLISVRESAWDAAEARLAEVEALDPDDLGHGLFCASHYESRPCDCWAIVVRAAARGEGDR